MVNFFLSFPSRVGREKEARELLTNIYYAHNK